MIDRKYEAKSSTNMKGSNTACHEWQFCKYFLFPVVIICFTNLFWQFYFSMQHMLIKLDNNSKKHHFLDYKSKSGHFKSTWLQHRMWWKILYWLLVNFVPTWLRTFEVTSSELIWWLLTTDGFNNLSLSCLTQWIPKNVKNNYIIKPPPEEADR